eukprot:jgi/Psemu1/296723/fgenesh1_pm.191_\
MVKSRRNVFRANLDDVENLSYGRGAKKQRGTGSRFTCHRLNRDERHLYDLAKRDGYLTVRGNGYRKERKGSPVWNTHRQRCDALEDLCIVVEKRSDTDRVVLDFSTLRVSDDSKVVAFILEKVFQSKYPEFYDALISEHAGHKNNDSRQERLEASSRVVNTTYRSINWEVVTTRPIWAVDERLIAVACARDVAKSIASDVLTESHENNSNAALNQNSATILPDLETVTSTGDKHYTYDETERIDTGDVTIDDRKIRIESDDIDCIDWNDI